MRYQAYSPIKESGVDWLGEIPTHWKVIPIKRSATIISGATPKSGVEAYWNGNINWITPADMGKSNNPYISQGSRSLTEDGLASCGANIVPIGTVVLSTRAPIGKLAIAAKDLCTNQGCKSLITFGSIESKFLYYVLSISEQQLNLLGRGTTFLELSSNELGGFNVCAPDVHEQSQIVTFLDHEITKINTLIDKQQQLIKLLKEKRQAVISHAVTKGLNPDAKMKDSGVEWLGEVPEHWKTVRIKNIVDTPVTDGPHETPNFVDEGIPFISAEAVSKGFINFNKIRGYISESDDVIYSKKYSPKIFDIYMVKSGATTGVTAIVETNDRFNIWSPLAAIRCRQGYSTYFVLNFMRSRPFQEAVENNWSFGTQQNIGMGVIENLHILRPPLDEASRIADHLSVVETKFHETIEKTTLAIELMKERRTALISAAVTGKIDVRNAA